MLIVPFLVPRPSGRIRRVVALTALLIAGLGVYAFLEAGRFMSREDPLQAADAIFVLAGTQLERPLEAADLYQAGYAPRLVLSRDVTERDTLLVARRGIRLPTRFELTWDLLRQLDIPEDALLAADRLHDNTAEEAETLRALALQYGWQRVIVVSSKYHLRRAGLACRRQLRGTGVQVLMRGSRYDPSVPDRWWQRRHDIRWLASEIPKYAAYAIGLGG